MIYFHTNYARSSYFNDFIYLVWMLTDSFSYYTLFSLWSFSMFISAVWVFFYHYLFFNYFTNSPIKIKDNFANFNNFLTAKNTTFNHINNIPNWSEKWSLYFWLQHNAFSSKNNNYSPIKQIFTNSSTNSSKAVLAYFHQLFRATHFLNLTTSSQLKDVTVFSNFNEFVLLEKLQLSNFKNSPYSDLFFSYVLEFTQCVRKDKIQSANFLSLKHLLSCD